jgi:hypothetical protein
MPDTPQAPPSMPQPARHFGRIEVHVKVLDNFRMATAIFKSLGFVPWDVSFDDKLDQFSMMGTSPMFRLVNPEEPAPYYTVNVREQGVADQDGVKGIELIITVLEQVAQFDDIDQPLTKNSKVVGGEQ